MGKLNQFGRLRGSFGHRFFHEHMPAPLEEQPGELIMGGRRRDDAQCVTGARRLRNRAEGGDAISFGDFPRGLGGDVVNAGEIDETGGGDFGVDAGMFLAERTGAEHSDFDSGKARCGLAVIGDGHGASVPLRASD